MGKMNGSLNLRWLLGHWHRNQLADGILFDLLLTFHKVDWFANIETLGKFT